MVTINRVFECVQFFELAAVGRCENAHKSRNVSGTGAGQITKEFFDHAGMGAGEFLLNFARILG